MNLTNEEIRIKIAQSLGLHTRHCLGFTMTHAAYRAGTDGEWKHFNSEEEADGWHERFPYQKWEKKIYTNASLLPNYPESLDACAEFEKTLTDDERRSYFFHLFGTQRLEDGDLWKAVAATARQRCIAYLKTLNLDQTL